AFRRWADPDYVTSKIGNVEVQASCRPRMEGFGLRSPAEDEQASRMTADARLPARTVREWLPRLRTPDADMLFIELRPADAGVPRHPSGPRRRGTRRWIVPAGELVARRAGATARVRHHGSGHMGQSVPGPATARDAPFSPHPVASSQAARHERAAGEPPTSI